MGGLELKKGSIRQENNKKGYIIKRKLYQQDGYVLVFVLFFLCCTLLCCSVLGVTLSEQFIASKEAVQKEQSRMLARSGWNLALEQLQMYGTANEIQSVQPSGEIAVSITCSDTDSATWNIIAEGSSGAYRRMASGFVQCFSLPFSDTRNWPVINTLESQDDAGILLLADSVCQLSENCDYPLGITSVYAIPVTVEVHEKIKASTLYIYGDLLVSGSLSADSVYITGTVTGAENIQCEHLVSAYVDEEIPYQIRVLKRSIT